LMAKYLNGHQDLDPPTYVPPGWDQWLGFASAYPYYFNYTVNDNGQLRHFGSADADYSTDVLFARAEQFVRAGDGRPFFLHLTPFAPHPPATPAPRHRAMFQDLAPARPPSYNEPDVSDKPSWYAQVPPLTAQQQSDLDALRL